MLQLWLDMTGRLVRRPAFWFLAAIIALITVFHYADGLRYPSFLVDLLSDLGLDREDFERIAYLAPVIWSAFLLGRRGAFVISLIAVACMLPHAIFISDKTGEAVAGSAAVFVLGNLVALSLGSLQSERRRRAELQEAQQVLEFQFQITKENERRLAALNQTAVTISESLDLEQVLDRATQNVLEVMQVDAALIHLLDQDASQLSLAAYRGIAPESASQLGQISLDHDFYRTVVETGQPLYLENASKDARLAIGTPPLKQSVGSLLVVPLRSKGKVMGTICVLMHSFRRFRDDEVELLSAIASQAGVAAENARLYEMERVAMQRLAVSEGNYRGLFENANDAIWVHDLEGNIFVANQACEQLTGYAVGELTTMNVRDYLSAENLALARRVRHRLLAGEPVEQPYEQRILRKDGSEAILMLTTSVVMGEGGPTGFQNIGRDVTEERRLRENLSFYLSEITKAQEEERKRIAWELHDDTLQALVAHARELDLLATGDTGLAENGRAALENLWQQANAILQGVRRLSQDLRPPTLDRLGFLPALERLVADVSEHSGIPIKTSLLGTERRMSEDVELMLYRIVQEALRNVWRHSEATEVEILVECDVRRTAIAIRDNGRGFELPRSMGALARMGKLGLAGMDERARLAGGILKIHTEPGKGTTIVVEVLA